MPEIATLPFAADANLEGYWKLEDAYTDSSTNGYDLTATNTPTFVAGKFGKGCDFELDSSQYAQIAAASCANLRIAGAQTWTAWMNLESQGDGSNHRTIAGVLDGAAIHSYVALRGSDTSEKVGFYVAGLTPNVVQSAASPSLATWTFVAGTWNGTNELAVWINNVKATASTTGSQTAFNGDEGFGISCAGLYESNNYFDGILDDVAVFSRALTDAEITQIYEETAGWFHMSI